MSAARPATVAWGAPTGAVVTASEAAAHATTEEALIAPFVEPATDYVERGVCGQFFRARRATGKWRVTAPGTVCVRLPGGSVEAVSGTLDGGALMPDRVWRERGRDFATFDVATVGSDGAELVVEWTAGTWAAVPAAVKHGVLMAAAALFAERDGAPDPGATVTWRDSVRDLLAPFTIKTGFEGNLLGGAGN